MEKLSKFVKKYWYLFVIASLTSIWIASMLIDKARFSALGNSLSKVIDSYKGALKSNDKAIKQLTDKNDAAKLAKERKELELKSKKEKALEEIENKKKKDVEDLKDSNLDDLAGKLKDEFKL